MFDEDIRQRRFICLVNLNFTQIGEPFQLCHAVDQGKCIFIDPKLDDLLDDSVAEVLREKDRTVLKLSHATVIQAYK
jgi:hypothetical protein